jgi:hypothetical protein
LGSEEARGVPGGRSTDCDDEEHDDKGVDDGDDGGGEGGDDAADGLEPAEEAHDAACPDQPQDRKVHVERPERDERERDRDHVDEVVPAAHEAAEPVRGGVEEQLGSEDDGEGRLDLVEDIAGVGVGAVGVEDGHVELRLRHADREVLGGGRGEARRRGGEECRGRASERGNLRNKCVVCVRNALTARIISDTETWNGVEL